MLKGLRIRMVKYILYLYFPVYRGEFQKRYTGLFMYEIKCQRISHYIDEVFGKISVL